MRHTKAISNIVYKGKWLLCITAFAALLSSCSNNSKEIELLNEEIDSLRQANSEREEYLRDMTMFISVLADGLDSIARQENMLLGSNQGIEGKKLSRAQLQQSLSDFEQTLNLQKERIALLADSLKARGGNLEKLNKIVDYLKLQLDEKDKIIKSLRADLNNKNISISQLQEKVATLDADNNKLSQKIERQVDILNTQNEIINEGYVKIGTASELKSLGLISGGFLKKKKVNYNDINKGSFIKIDIRVFVEMNIPSKSPKILTQMPASSYRITSNGDGTSTLKILNPTSFWSVSNYLIIQK